MIDSHRRRLALLVAACYFMENLDGTIVTTAAPKLRAALGVSPTAIGLLISTYLITFAIVIPVGNWLMALVGERRLFLSAIAAFTLASLLCALSGNFNELVVARSLQGAAGALMVPVGRIIVLANSEKSDIMRLVAYVVWPSLLAPAIAPLVGGVIVTLGSWRWLFLPNVPLGVVALIVGSVMMRPSSRQPTRRSPFDGRGMILTGAGLGGLVYSAFVAGDVSSSWQRVGLDAAISVLVSVAAIKHLLRHPDPFLDLKAIRVPTFRQSLRGIVPFTIVVGSVPLLLPLLFQERFGWSPIKSGVVVLFVFLGNVVAKPSTTLLFNRLGHRRVLLISSSVVVTTMVIFALCDNRTPVGLISVVAFIHGVVRSIGYTGFLTLVYSDVPPPDMAHGTTLAATVQQVSAGFAASAGVLALRVGSTMSHGGALNTQNSYRIAFFLLAGLGLTVVLSVIAMQPSAGNALLRGRGEDESTTGGN